MPHYSETLGRSMIIARLVFFFPLSSQHYRAIICSLPFYVFTLSWRYCRRSQKLKINYLLLSLHYHKIFLLRCNFKGIHLASCERGRNPAIPKIMQRTTRSRVFSTEITDEDVKCGVGLARRRGGNARRNFYAIFRAVPIARVRPLILCSRAHCWTCAQ